MAVVEEAEMRGHFLHSNSQVKENGESNGSESSPSRKSLCRWLRHFVRCRTTTNVIVVSVILNIILAVIVTVGRCEVCPAPPPTFEVNPCPNGWVGYNGKCYYFAEAEEDWVSSKGRCASLNASLAFVDSQEEIIFMLRYKGSADHWLGLQKDPEHNWRWINGSLFNERFSLRGGGSCAYLNHEGIASSGCTREERWICSKPAERSRIKADCINRQVSIQ